MNGDQVISSYTWQQAVEDGVLVKVLPETWDIMTKGKPVLATSGIFGFYKQKEINEIFYAFTKSEKQDQGDIFSIVKNERKVWVIPDAITITIMFPEEY